MVRRTGCSSSAQATQRLGAAQRVAVEHVVVSPLDGAAHGRAQAHVAKPANLQGQTLKGRSNGAEHAPPTALWDDRHLAAATSHPVAQFRRRPFSAEAEQIHFVAAGMQKRQQMRRGVLIGTGCRQREARAQHADAQRTLRRCDGHPPHGDFRRLGSGCRH